MSEEIISKKSPKTKIVVLSEEEEEEEEEEDKDLVNGIEDLNIEDVDFYVHIDIISGSSLGNVIGKINSFMIRHDSFDPRRAVNFPTDLLGLNEDTLGNRRKTMTGMSRCYYEFWKVRCTFPIQDFANLIHSCPKGVTVRMVTVINNEHSIFRFLGTQ
jgi:hypothetical protein